MQRYTPAVLQVRTYNPQAARTPRITTSGVAGAKDNQAVEWAVCLGTCRTASSDRRAVPPKLRPSMLVASAAGRGGRGQ